MTFIGGLLIGWGLTQAAMVVHACRGTYWERSDKWILAALLGVAALGGLMWWGAL